MLNVKYKQSDLAHSPYYYCHTKILARILNSYTIYLYKKKYYVTNFLKEMNKANFDMGLFLCGNIKRFSACEKNAYLIFSFHYFDRISIFYIYYI